MLLLLQVLLPKDEEHYWKGLFVGCAEKSYLQVWSGVQGIAGR
jgi:hypothetical protein